MTDQRETEAPRIYPTMRCRDAEAMIRWLKEVVGFTEYVVYRKDGTVQHAELAYGSSLLMLGQSRDDEYGKLVGDIGGRRTDALYVAVDDPDAMHDRVKASTQHRLWQPRLCLPGPGRQSLEFWHLLAEDQ
jgi:uncharacterized glyoxalase superfamily protein PhnB